MQILLLLVFMASSQEIQNIRIFSREFIIK